MAARPGDTRSDRGGDGAAATPPPAPPTPAGTRAMADTIWTDRRDRAMTEHGIDQPGGHASRRAPDVLSRMLGGPPLAVLARLVLLSVLVGVILSAIGLDPANMLASVEALIEHVWDMGFDALRWAWRYFLLGAILVLPIWLISRLTGGARR